MKRMRWMTCLLLVVLAMTSSEAVATMLPEEADKWVPFAIISYNKDIVDAPENSGILSNLCCTTGTLQGDLGGILVPMWGRRASPRIGQNNYLADSSWVCINQTRGECGELRFSSNPNQLYQLCETVPLSMAPKNIKIHSGFNTIIDFVDDGEVTVSFKGYFLGAVRFGAPFREDLETSLLYLEAVPQWTSIYKGCWYTVTIPTEYETVQLEQLQGECIIMRNGIPISSDEYPDGFAILE